MADRSANLEVIANDIKHIMKDVDEVKTTLGSKYVTVDQFEPIKKLVYGLVGLILTSVAVAVMGLVIVQQ